MMVVCAWCGNPDCEGKCPESKQIMAALTERDANYIGPIQDDGE